jgi:DNA-binding LacI/PurR family transcriptional regulator
MPEVTIRDVANEAGLSVSSVSRILRGGQGHVYPTETHDRVRAIADRLGYRANAAARLLRQNTRTLVGMSVHLTEHPHLNRFLVVVRDELIKRGYDPVILDSKQLGGTEVGQAFPPPHMLVGLINLGVDLEQEWPEHYAALRKIMPMVAIQAVSPAAAAWVDVVHVDYQNAFFQAARHLRGLGHQHIAYLGPIDGLTPTDAHKYRGWRAAAIEAGLNPDYYIPWTVVRTEAQVQMDDLMSEAKIQQAVKSVAAQWAALQPRPTAIICASDEVAVCLQSYLQAQGWKLPQDLSIVGYDGITFGAYVYPALTTVAPNYDAMADAAISRLLQSIAQDEPGSHRPPTEVFITPHLIVRGSTISPS